MSLYFYFVFYNKYINRTLHAQFFWRLLFKLCKTIETQVHFGKTDNNGMSLGFLPPSCVGVLSQI